jgi:hypothetical protein
MQDHDVSGIGSQNANRAMESITTMTPVRQCGQRNSRRVFIDWRNMNAFVDLFADHLAELGFAHNAWRVAQGRRRRQKRGDEKRSGAVSSCFVPW